MPTHLHLEAIVLKRHNYSDADRFITFFSHSHGKLSALARGVRRLSSTKRASLEPFSRVRLHAVKTHQSYVLTETRLVHSFPTIRQDLVRLTKAYQVLEIIDRLTAEEEAHPEVFDKLLSCLHRIEASTHTNTYVVEQVKSILEYLGFGTPSIDSDLLLKEHIESITERSLVTKQFFTTQKF